MSENENINNDVNNSNEDVVDLPPGFESADPEDLQVLDALGIGEGDFGESHEVPADLVETHEALEFAAQVAKEESNDGPDGNSD